jgi:hypothetical protein
LQSKEQVIGAAYGHLKGDSSDQIQSKWEVWRCYCRLFGDSFLKNIFSQTIPKAHANDVPKSETNMPIFGQVTSDCFGLAGSFHVNVMLAGIRKHNTSGLCLKIG